MQFFLVSRIKNLLKHNRAITIIVHDDDNTEEIMAYFNKKHYKVQLFNNTLSISKRWWQI